ncbi:MAG: hypothetical protein QNK03_07235 [Myxococcota bacterium]|nr:hypothetical protein [Myxococcota bacterium]
MSRRSTPRALTRSLVPAALLAGILLAVPASALTEHFILVGLEDLDGSRIAGDDAAVSAPTPAELTTDIAAAFSHPRGASAGAIGRFGNLGVTGNQSGPGELFSQLTISSDDFVNRLGTDQRARMNFIVDGGFLLLDAAPQATLDLTLTISVEGVSDCRTCFRSSIHLEDPSEFGGTAEVTLSGDDLGATVDGSRVDIPFSFQSVDLGVVPAGGRVSIEYFLNIRSDVPRFAEVLRYEFSDPLSTETESMERPVVLFAAIPEPRPALGVLLGLLVLGRERWKRR